MRTVYISDITMQQPVKAGGAELSFREKLELCRLLDKLGVPSIETGRVENRRIDGLLLKSISSAVENACLTVPVPVLEEDGAAFVWSCLREAKRPRLQVALPMSTVQMEYLYHRKPEAMLELIESSVAACRALCRDVEFCAQDAGRSEPEFLRAAIERAVKAGAGTVTVCESAGDRLPDEFGETVRSIRVALPGDVRLGVMIANDLYLADACAVSAIRAGADEVKACAAGDRAVSLKRLAAVLNARGGSFGVRCGLRTTELGRVCRQIEWLCRTEREEASPFDLGVREEESFLLGAHEDRQAVRKAAERLGYLLTEEDAERVFQAYLRIVDKKERISAKELDVLIATSAMQVPATYTLEHFSVNSGNVMSATAHLRLLRNGCPEEGVSVGDGPIDAAFLAIEKITGAHYELDDFQIRAVTEGREAMGEAVVRLRSGGRLYAGRGISTDIVGSSIMAYVNALNKIVYEETEA